MVPGVDQTDNLECCFTGTVDRKNAPSYWVVCDSRIAFLGINQVRDFEVQGKVGFVVGDIAGMT